MWPTSSDDEKEGGRVGTETEIYGGTCAKGSDKEEEWEGRGGGGGWKVGMEILLEAEIGTTFSVTVLSTSVKIEVARFRDDVDHVS